MSPKISVIIPFYNEADNIAYLVTSLNNFFAENTDYLAEVIFVNDGSKDNSVELLKKESHRNYESKIVSFSKNYGAHAAVRAGIANAKGDYITSICADLQDPLEVITRLLAECKKDNDIVWAFRKSTASGFAERTFSKIYSSLMKKYAISTYPAKGFDIVMFSRKVQQFINQNIEANSNVFLQILTFGFSQSSIGYDKQARKTGKSKWTISKKIKLFIDSFVAFSFAPIRLVSMVGISFFFLGLLWTIYIITRKLLFNDLAAGWPALMSILMIGFGITNISLGIIAEYLWRTLDASRKRPVFIIDEIIELNHL